MPFLRRVAGYLKPTTEAAQRFGRLARKNILELQRDQMEVLCHQGEIPWKRGEVEQGYVFLVVESWVWGCGLFLDPDRLLCRLPRAMKNWWACRPSQT